MRVALASCQQIPEPDPDEEILLAALREASVEPSVLAWDDPSARFAEHDLVVLRSTWNYHEDVVAFLRWIRATAEHVPVLNPPEVVALNVEKTYLRDLPVPAIPTHYVGQGESCDVAGLLASEGWSRVVIKPVVSAGSYRTARFDRGDDDAQTFLDGLTRDRGAMIQPWIASVDTYGERSLVWVDGEITHAVRKAPRFAGGAESVSAGSVAIADDERAFAMKALSGLDGLLYARVDMVRDADGVLRVMELELVEPSLFLKQSATATKRLVDGIFRRLASG